MDLTTTPTGGSAASRPAHAGGSSRTEALARPVRPIRPFLKWAGGKRQLLPALRAHYPAQFGTYHEPFLGSGAVFFDLVARGGLRPHRVRLTDINPDLAGCWQRLSDVPDNVIRELRMLASDRAAAPETHYYQVRDERFNPAREAIGNGSGPRAADYTATLAAMLIYLNRTGFNGLFRVNSRGAFNVPRGRYRNPRVCDEANLRRVSAALRELDAVIEHAPYDRVLGAAERGDFIYLDPPYAPLSPTASFTSYTADRFDHGDQNRLQQVVIALAERGCHVLLSNSTAPEITALYDGNVDAERAGLRAHRVPARRAINADATRRGAIAEYVITNIPGRTT